jgi:phosphomannomutase/phosphoglucomutase
MSIFKAYDIRGIYPGEIDESVAFRIGKAFGTLNPGKIAVGCDTRLSSPQLKHNFIKGIISTGSEVRDIGVVTTPAVILAIKHFKCNGGVNVTASHNPRDYNGFKLLDKNAMPISYESGICKIEEILERKSYIDGKGCCLKLDIKEDYIKFIRNKVKLENRLSVVIDASNGAAGLYAPEIYKRLGMRVEEMNCKPDGNFPGHEPDPSKQENLLDARNKVKEIGADMGVVYDGDGDRLAIIDEKGNIIESRRIFSLLVGDLLKKKRSGKIVHDVLTSGMVIETINKFGGIPIVCRVGHTYIAQKMGEEDAELGGELSGHYYFKDSYFGDDAIFASLKVAEIISKEGRKISQLVQDFPEYFSQNVRIGVKESRKFYCIDKLKEELKQEGYLLDFFDGVKVMFDQGWVVFRGSHTEPKISIAYESKDKKEYEEIKNFVQTIIPRIGEL